MHFCADELLAIMMALPFIGTFIAIVRARWRRWRKGEPPAPPPSSPSADFHHIKCHGHPLCTCRELIAWDRERRQRKAMKREREGTYRGRV